MINFEKNKIDLRWKLMTVVAFSHILLLFSNAVMWDSCCLWNLYESKNYTEVAIWFSEMGIPQLTYLHIFMFSLPQALFFYKLISFACVLFSSLFIFQTLLFFKNFTPNESFFISLITATFPIYTIWFEPVMLQYNLSYLLFYAGMYFYVRHFQKQKNWALLICSFIFLFCSFTIQSFLVFTYAILLGLFLYNYNREISFQKNSFGFIKLHALLLLIPMVYFISFKKIFPPHGSYATYNQLLIAEPHFVSKFVITFAMAFYKISIQIALEIAKAFIHNSITIIITSAVAASILFLFKKTMLKNDETKSGKKWLLIFSSILLLAALFPYTMVGKFPSVLNYNCRNGLLVSLPIALFTVGLGRFKKMQWLIYLVAGIGISFTLYSGIYWQNRYIHSLAITAELKKIDENSLMNTIEFTDNANRNSTNQLVFYEWNYLMSNAWQTQAHLGYSTNSKMTLTNEMKKGVAKNEVRFILRNFLPGDYDFAFNIREGGYYSKIIINDSLEQEAIVTFSNYYFKNKLPHLILTMK